MQTDEQRNAIAAKIAREAAEAFTYGDGSQDDTSAARNVADIMNDLPADERASFALKVFGLPYYELRKVATTREHDNGRGIPDVARVLVSQYHEEIIEWLFSDYPSGEVNLSAFLHAVEAMEAVANLSAFEYGGAPLDNCAEWIDKLRNRAELHAIGAVQNAAWNDSSEEV